MEGEYFYPVDSVHKLIPGSFMIDYEQNKVVMKVRSKPARWDRIELAAEKEVLRISNQHNVIVEGLIVEQAGWALANAVVFENITNLLVKNCRFDHNRYTGLQLHRVRNATFLNVSASFNGGKGAAGSWNGFIRNVVFDSFKANYNNWIGVEMDYVGWDPCAVKWSATRDVVIRNSEFIGNFSAGLWLDTENRRMTVENCIIADNLATGIYVEANRGPVTFRRCVSRNNYFGIQISCSEDVIIDRCVIENNDFQIKAFDHWLEGRGPDHFEYDLKDTDDGSKWTVHALRTRLTHSTVRNRKGNGNPLYSAMYNDKKGFAKFVETLTADNNCFFTELPEKAFWLDDKFYDLNGWQTVTQKDKTSVWNK